MQQLQAISASIKSFFSNQSPVSKRYQRILGIGAIALAAIACSALVFTAYLSKPSRHRRG